ncbi:FixH family protein [Labrys sp. LIt4]|uniref:Heavy metal RND transporter n=1 Tax=Labrys okinawensis TaxID=346911 RepID=A0A2S9Q523_9HYPH|nr:MULTISPECIES: FixH family protein [Labrys]MBP0579082.1 FixH family protein [Labrys sp. LIt4]PRH84459.1 heavy metal RND transporter [Labrys okinawensis]
MTSSAIKQAAIPALIGFAWTIAAPAQAGIEDYEFQLIQPEIRQSESAEIAVRLVDKRSGKPIPDAVIFASRLDMAPDGMETMKAPIEPLASSQAGIYRFKARLGMEGGWRLSLAAKLQGETGTLQARLIFRAVP